MFNFAGGMLTGTEIERQIKKGNISITPYDPSCVNPNSYNLKLHPQLLIYKRYADRANIIKQTSEICYDHIVPLVSSVTVNDKGKITDEPIKIDTSRSELSEEDIRELLNPQKHEMIKEFKSLNSNSNTKPESEEAAHITCGTDDSITLIPIDNTHLFKDRVSELEDITNIKIKTLEDAINDNTNDIKTTNNKFDQEINQDRNRLSHLEQLPSIDSYHLPPLDMKSKNETIEITIPEEGLVLQPGVLYIGRTVERTWTDKFIPMINGRSSGGRLGIAIHICAGFGDIGFDGTWTLEITVVEPVRIYPNTEIAQVCYFKPCGKTKKLYRGRYHGQTDATASRFFMNKENTNNE